MVVALDESAGDRGTVVGRGALLGSTALPLADGTSAPSAVYLSTLSERNC